MELIVSFSDKIKYNEVLPNVIFYSFLVVQ